MKGGKQLTIVIKLGTSSIVDEKSHEPWLSNLSLIVETAVKLRKDGHRVVLVSSGAIGIALRTMGYDRRPKPLPRVQALAAIGQCQLMSLWERLFNYRQQTVAQVLLTRNDIADRTQYVNAQNTFTELLKMGVVPIVNENDTLAVTEIKFGDNDTLSAITAGMVQADYLFLMTDVDCLYNANPRTHPDAVPIEVVTDLSSLTVDVSSAGSALGTGGMSTKLVAARLATSAGVTTIITRSSKPGNVFDIVAYLQALKAVPAAPGTGPTSAASTPPISTSTQSTASDSQTLLTPVPPLPPPPLHTRFLPSVAPMRDRPFWLLHGLAAHGTVYIDAGAFRALRRKAGLLPAGVIDVEGSFGQQEAVRLVVVPREATDDYFGRHTPSLVATPAPGTPKEALTNGGLGGYEGACDILDVLPASSVTIASTTGSRPTTPSRLVSSSGVLQRSLGQQRHGHSRHGSTATLAHHPDVREVGRALVNYSSAEIARIKGCQSSDISNLLGYAESEYVALRENVSLLDGTTVKVEEYLVTSAKDS